MRVINLHKEYITGNKKTGGAWKMRCFTSEISEEELFNYELSSPIYKNFNIILGVEPNSAFEFWNDNPYASLLFNQTINGNVIITIDNDSDDNNNDIYLFDKLYNTIINQIIEKEKEKYDDENSL